MPKIRFRKIDLQSLIVGCQNEATRSSPASTPFEGEGYCFELFRRAIEKRDAAAWDAIHQQYRRMLVFWVGLQQDDLDELVNQAFAKFWHSFSDRDLHHFSHVGQVLKYLKQCAISVRLDEYRRQQRDRLWTTSENERQGQVPTSVEDVALDNVVRHQRKAQVEARLCDDHERLVVYLSFELGLCPSEIVRRYPHRFADVEEVRRIKERVVKRLKGDVELRQWLE